MPTSPLFSLFFFLLFPPPPISTLFPSRRSSDLCTPLSEARSCSCFLALSSPFSARASSPAMLPSPVNFFLAKFARPRWASVTTSAAGCPRRRPSPLEQWRRNSVFFLRSFYWRELFLRRPCLRCCFRKRAAAN